MAARPSCDACGLPPRPNKSLLQCTRCKQAHYHDKHCQKNHYSKHKAACRRIAASNITTVSASSAPSQPRTTLVETRKIEGRGRSLFAASKLAIGDHPLTTLCAPIAHPVLLESTRSMRCSFCFQSIQHDKDTSKVVLKQQNNRLHRHCSIECKNLDMNWMNEETAARKLPSPPSPTALSCARILCECHKSPATSAMYDELCCSNMDSISNEEKETYLSIMTQCHLFLLAMNGTGPIAQLAHDLLYPNNLRAIQFMSRMCMNGFTISDSEQFAIGHGVYCQGSMINHSCRPNAVPSFWIRTSVPPMLQITVCTPIYVGDEITIAYCDVSTPRHVRCETLMMNYKFICDCAHCKNTDQDDAIVGLKCTLAGCKCEKVTSIDDGTLETNRKYQCNTCGNRNFVEALNEQASSMEQLKQLEVTMNIGNSHNTTAGDKVQLIYERLKRCCQQHTSYYTAWSADLFVTWCANALGYLRNEDEQLNICHRALVILNDRRQAAQLCFNYPGNLSWSIKQGIEAKLRLFVNPMDMEALQMLQDVRKTMLVFYPPTDDMITMLDESLAAYSFS
jgi:hypothetical protein